VKSDEKGGRCRSNQGTSGEAEHVKVTSHLGRRRKEDLTGRPAYQDLLINQENRHCVRQVDGGSLGKAMAHGARLRHNIAALGYR
jgi:hypothetical protein